MHEAESDPGREDADDFRPEPDDMPAAELDEAFHRLLESPEMQILQEAFRPGLYINFIPAAGDSPRQGRVGAGRVRRPGELTLGPYLGVAIADGRLYVETDDGDEVHAVCLATAEAGGWALHDGTHPGCIYWLRVHTFSPEVLAQLQGKPEEQ
jgi:hypothetical protein